MVDDYHPNRSTHRVSVGGAGRPLSAPAAFHDQGDMSDTQCGPR